MFLIVPNGWAQEKFNGNFEPFIELEYNLTKNFSQEFSIEGRVKWYDKKDYMFKAKQLDVAHFSSFQLNNNHDLALGIQYRFEENFGGSDENELRLTEEYTYEVERGNTELENRLRVEQRFASTFTSHRFRYKFEIHQALNPNKFNRNDITLSGNLETLLTISKTSKAEYEQRIGAELGWPITPYVALEIGIEYRLDDFTGDLGHELFIVTGISLKLQ